MLLQRRKTAFDFNLILSAYFKTVNLSSTKIFLVLILSAIIFSCNSPSAEQDEKTVSRNALKEQMVRVNKSQTYSEQNQIEEFISRYNYKMDTTGTGLRYLIYKKANGKTPDRHSTVVINYEVKLLDGTICYNSDSTGDLEFEIGKTDLPVGLQEGLQLMNIGEKAIFISQLITTVLCLSGVFPFAFL